MGRVHRFLLCLASSTTLVILAPWVILSAESNAVGLHGNVTSIPAGGLIRTPANLFDLEETTVRFTPNSAGGYAVEVGALT